MTARLKNLREGQMFTTAEIIELAIRIEKNGEKTYRKAQEKAFDLSMVTMLQRLADEEMEHARWFTELKKRAGVITNDPELEAMGESILKSVLGDQAFSITDVDFSKMEDRRKLLETALEFEEDTILFYELLGSFMGDEESLQRLQEIIEEERRHVRNLRETFENFAD